MTRKKTRRRQPLPMQTTRQSAMSFFGVPRTTSARQKIRKECQNHDQHLHITSACKLVDQSVGRDLSTQNAGLPHLVLFPSNLHRVSVSHIVRRTSFRPSASESWRWRNESLNGGFEGLFWDLTVPARTAELSGTVSLLLGVRAASYLDGH